MAGEDEAASWQEFGHRDAGHDCRPVSADPGVISADIKGGTSAPVTALYDIGAPPVTTPPTSTPPTSQPVVIAGTIASIGADELTVSVTDTSTRRGARPQQRHDPDRQLVGRLDPLHDRGPQDRETTSMPPSPSGPRPSAPTNSRRHRSRHHPVQHQAGGVLTQARALMPSVGRQGLELPRGPCQRRGLSPEGPPERGLCRRAEGRDSRSGPRHRVHGTVTPAVSAFTFTSKSGSIPRTTPPVVIR